MKLPNLYYEFNYKQLHSFRCKALLKSTVLSLGALLQTKSHIQSLTGSILHVPKIFPGQSGNFRFVARRTTYQLNIDTQAWLFIVKNLLTSMAQIWNYFNNSYEHALYFALIYSWHFKRTIFISLNYRKHENTNRHPETNHHDSTNCPIFTTAAFPLLIEDN